jgi:putative transposase
VRQVLPWNPVTPRNKEGVSKLMQSVGRPYVQYFNHQHGCTGTLWDGRRKTSLVDAEHYLLTLYRCIELNLIRAGMARTAEDYR